MEGGRKEGNKEKKYVYFLLLNNSLGKKCRCKEFLMSYSENTYKFIYRNDVGKKNPSACFLLNDQRFVNTLIKQNFHCII